MTSKSAVSPPASDAGGVGTIGETRSAPAVWERRVAFYVIAAALFFSTLPYLLGYALSRPDYQFVGQAYNIDDYCVYLSWTRQAADGHFYARDLFTTEPQKNVEFNALFLLLGLVVRISHLPISIVLQAARILAGGLLLALIYRFYRNCAIGSPAARLTALGLASFGAGLGWLYWPAWADKNVGRLPVDVWQPEAFTFLSVYYSALFAVSTVLILVALYSALRGEQTGRARYGVYAGLCGLVLGNIHSYDIIHIMAAWGLFLVLKTIIERRFAPRNWGRAVLAGAITLPSVAYQFWVFRADPAFHARAEVPTLSPEFIYYILGYGLTIVLAAVAVALLIAGKRTKLIEQFSDRTAALFVGSWSVGVFVLIYVWHVAFQRKMLMGEDIPLCLLAGAAAAFLTQNWPVRWRVAALAALVAISFPTNALFIYRDYMHLVEDRSETSLSPYLTGYDLDALGWIRANSAPSDAVLGFPELMAFVPGYCDRSVYLGHWSETPKFGEKVQGFVRFAQAGASDADRIAFLRETGCAYLVYPNDVSAMSAGAAGPLAFADFAGSPPPYLAPVHRNKMYTIFAIRIPSSAAQSHPITLRPFCVQVPNRSYSFLTGGRQTPNPPSPLPARGSQQYCAHFQKTAKDVLAAPSSATDGEQA